MTNICSIWAYDEIKKSGYVGECHAQYLFIFSANEALTHIQATKLVEKYFNRKLPQRNGRIAELEDMGFIEKVDMVVCEYTGKTVNRWKYTGRREPYSKSWVDVRCQHCKGAGFVKKEVYVKDLNQLRLFQ